MLKQKVFIGILGLIIIIAIIIQILRLDILVNLTHNKFPFYDVQTYEKIELNKEEIDGIIEDVYLILYDNGDINSIDLKENIYITLNYMKKKTIALDYRERKSISEYKNVIVTFESNINGKFLDELIHYTDIGGHVFFGTRPIITSGKDADVLLSYLGISETYGIKNTDGIQMLTNILIYKMEAVVGENLFKSSSLDVLLKADTKVHCISSDNIPIIWEKKYNKGKVIIFNGSLLHKKINRGIIAGILGNLNDIFIYPIFNIKMAHIDDFPAPIPQGIDENIYKEFRRDIPAYYREVWWTDIIKGSKKYDIKYTGFVIESYDDNVKPPFIGEDSSKNNSFIVYGRELLKNNGEVGIHGYNHQPLVFDGYITQELGYKPWGSIDDMIISLEEAMKFTQNIYPKYSFYSYVPPSNILSPEGRIAVKKGLPDIKAICGLYLPDPNNEAYVTEITIDEDRIVDLPRLTSGYNYDDEVKWTIMNSMTVHGYFSHFIHPDDSLDAFRSKGKEWKDLIKGYNDMLKELHDNFPWLRSMITYKAALEVERFYDTEVYINEKSSKIDILINNFTSQMYFYYWSDVKPIIEGDASALKVVDGLYLIRMREPQITINKE